MPDIDGNFDNNEMYSHISEKRQVYSDSMNATRVLQNQDQRLTSLGREELVAIAKAAHDCLECSKYAGNPPAVE